MKSSVWLLAVAVLAGCSDPDNPGPANTAQSTERALSPGQELTVAQNKAAYIPAQCYTNPKDARGTGNPCYVCHTDSQEPNYLNDAENQLIWALPENALSNHWDNLFVDHSADVAAISDQAIDNYVSQSNYQGPDDQLVLADVLADVPKRWDANQNGRWDGYVPDAYYRFDNQGFDHSPTGSFTGWRSFAYFPVPGAFMPTNGSTDDVLIRLPEAYRQNRQGEFDLDVYRTNLAIVQALIQRADAHLAPVNERALGMDLDGNGVLSTADRIHYDWAPLEGRTMHWAGRAGELDRKEAPLAAGLFPLGTEFLHSVRYLTTGADGAVAMAPRMKELRYAVKTSWRTYYDLQTNAENDVKERHDYPDRLKLVPGNTETGVATNLGWRYQGFIEAEDGALRPQNYEELLTCNGCHSGIGATTDGTFAFARKVPDSGFQNGWYHWQQKAPAGLADPKRRDGEGEYAFYLRHNPWGNAFRSNDELHDRFFTADGAERPEAFAALSRDIAMALQPSVARARQLNKAYRVLVQEQSFIHGRDAFVTPPAAAQREVSVNQPTGIEEVLQAR
ncbi:hypothetical protein [Marinobacter sp. C2H3]|uniref:hypothetical protein n=1 Tax=Marinobacter sp. C2H3 TaxID=3119003 RepID=UPI00300F4201